jgi:hypothetical protein
MVLQITGSDADTFIGQKLSVKKNYLWLWPFQRPGIF